MNNMQHDKEPGYYDLVREISRLNVHIDAKDIELKQTRADAALVVDALTCAVQFAEVLLAFYPVGSPLHPHMAAAKRALADAMNAIRQREPKP
jgi:hypothetical protein